MIRLELLDRCDEQTWDGMVAASESGTIFHTMAWARVIETLHKAQTLPLGIFEGSDLIGVFPLFRVRRGPLTVLASPPGVGYGGPLVSAPHVLAVMEHLDRLAKHFGGDYIEFRLGNQLTATTLAERRYTVESLPTYRIALKQDLTKLWSNLEQRCRTSIRKALKNGVEIVEATGKGFMDVYYEMVKDTYGRSNRPPPRSPQDYSTVWDILRPYERIKVLLARYENRVIAGLISLPFSDSVYGWDSAAFQAHLSLNANNLLHWTLIEWGASQGLREYDMMGSSTPRIAHFLQSFGGDLRTYTHAYRDLTRSAYIGRRLYRWLVPQIRRIQFRLRPA